jgi:hypothetical protein
MLSFGSNSGTRSRDVITQKTVIACSYARSDISELGIFPLLMTVAIFDYSRISEYYHLQVRCTIHYATTYLERGSRI